MLKKRPILVLFFMNGCHHCAENQPAWDAAKKKVGGNVVEIESSAVPDSAGVQGFPTMKYIDASGKTTETGKKQSGDEIIQALGVPTKGGLRRRRSLRRRTHRRNRKLRHRTLRNHVSLA